MACTSISFVIPALNEESYIGPTLDSLTQAMDFWGQRHEVDVEIIVVDNGSIDKTADIARARGAVVVDEPAKGSVSTARNAGARAATGQLLIFVDADTHWPEPLLARVIEVMSDPKCIGGAVDTDYRPHGLLVRAYLRFWRVLSKMFRMAQGATQFCLATSFSSLGGYDETIFMGEDVDFYWRLRKTARSTGSSVTLIDDVKVVPSCRRFDKWPFWKTLFYTNPLIAMFFQRSKKPWGGWYKHPTR